ncbi:protein of unknown function [Roseateles sp. YR242]|nr:protein of unknown function [Roseateles sp. YR242]
MAHELFHSLTWERMAPERRESNALGARAAKSNVRIEQLADNFAAALLMPTASLNALVDPDRAKDADHLADIARQLRVSTDALGWRLRGLGRIDEATRLKLAATRRAESPTSETPKPFSTMFVKELHAALDRGRLTARKAASALGMTLGELADLFKTYELSDPFRS